MKTVTLFETVDGKQFATEPEARAHERESAPMLLVGLTFEQVQAAIMRKDVPLADAIEQVAGVINKTRYAAGDKRFTRGGKAAPDVVVDVGGKDIDGASDTSDAAEAA